MKNLVLLFSSILSLNIAFAQELPEEQVAESVFTVVESMPVFSEVCLAFNGDSINVCSIKKIQEYVAKVDYPQEAIDADIEGKVYISFVVGKDGNVIDVHLLRGVHKLLDDASLAHIKNMPTFFKPGFQRGKEVKVKYNIPIVFGLYSDTPAKLSKKEMKRLRKETRKKYRKLKQN